MFRVELHGAGDVVTLYGGDEGPAFVTPEGITGFYDLPGLKTEFAPRVGTHGAVPAPAEYSARTVTIVGSDDYEARPEQVALWERINAMREGRLRVVDVGRDSFVDGVLETEYPTGWTFDPHRFVLRIVAADPRRYSWDEQHVILTPGARSGALTYPISYPIDYTDGDDLASPTGTVENAGNIASHPVIVVRGAHRGGFTLLDSQGRTISTTATLYAGNRVEVDCARRMLLIDGVNQSRLLDRREWFEIPAGGRLSITYQPAGETPAGTAWAELHARSAWI